MAQRVKLASLLKVSLILAIVAMFLVPGLASAQADTGSASCQSVTAMDTGQGLTASTIASITPKSFQNGTNVVMQGRSILFIGEGFVPGEFVNVFYTAPNGAACSIATVQADVNGEFQVIFNVDGLAPGNYRVTGLGQWSGLRAIANFVIRQGTAPATQGLAQLEADFLLAGAPTRQTTAGAQNNWVLLNGMNFIPGEWVNCWLTQPDGSVNPITGAFQVSGASEFTATVALPATLVQVGRVSITCRGADSGRTAVANLQVTHGNGVAPAGVGNTTPQTSLTCTPNVIRHSNFPNFGAGTRTVAECHASGFLAGEKVAFFITRPDGTVDSLGNIQLVAMASGVDILISESSCTALGRYALTAVGLTTGFVAITYFDVTD